MGAASGLMGMSRAYAFTTAAMSAALEDTPVTYEDLAEIERDFDDAETEISKFPGASNAIIAGCNIHLVLGERETSMTGLPIAAMIMS